MSKVMLNRLVPIWDRLCKSAQGAGCATSEDRRSFRTRARSEGLPYLSDGLAGLGRIFLDALRRGYVEGESFSQIRFALKEGSTLPVFLYSAWSKVFNDDGSGRGASFEMRDGIQTLASWDPPITACVAVSWLRQLTVVYSKMRLPYDSATVQEVYDRFRRNENSLAVVKGHLWMAGYATSIKFPYLGDQTQDLSCVLSNARRLISRILCNVDPRDITPRHGSGASACRTRPWERYNRILFDPDINAIWPYVEFTSAGISHSDQILSSDFINDTCPKMARGVFVPKDYRGPRLISCEPASSMYYQQGLMTLLVTHLEQHPQTSGFVNFTDQSINQRLARQGSQGQRKLATLDLKDASDLLSWDLVTLLWPDHWFRALRAVRSKVTEIAVPDKGTVRVPLRKHAPMGSAVCFPVMALTLWALIKAARFSKERTKVWIYGDDIVAASHDVAEIVKLLGHVDLKVNVDKSFYGPTPFRESCGKEYWNGTDVTPIYLRYDPTNNDTDIGSLCSFACNYALAKGPSSAYEITEIVQQLTGAPIRGVDERWQTIGWDSDVRRFPLLEDPFEPSFMGTWGITPRPHLLIGTISQCTLDTVKQRWNRDLLRREYRLRVPHPVNVGVKPVNWGYVLRSTLIGGDMGFTESAALAKRVRYKYSWVSIDW